MNLRPMDTAPRDGRCIILYDAGADPLIVRWNGSRECFDGEGRGQTGVFGDGWLPLPDGGEDEKIAAIREAVQMVPHDSCVAYPGGECECHETCPRCALDRILDEGE